MGELIGHATPDNIDYNDLKHLIKVYTSNDQSRPRTVPSGNNVSTALLRFEQELYTELQRQHDRISDFVHVKAGELSRRLGQSTRPTHQHISIVKHVRAHMVLL